MTFTNLAYKIHYTRGNDIASASTLPLFADGDYFHVTGTETITRLANMAKGMQVLLKFNEPLSIEYDSDYLILPNAESLFVFPGDVLRFIQYDDDGKWRMVEGGSGGVGPESGVFESSKSRASLGARIDINGDFTTNINGWSGTNWAWSSANGGCAQHTSGSTDPLAGIVPVEEGHYYYGEVEIAGNNGTISIQIGTFLIPQDEDNYYFTADGIFDGGLRAYGTGDADVIITPSSDFTGQINFIRFYKVIEATPAIYIFDEDSTDACDIMADNELDNQFMGVDSGVQTVTGSHNICFGKNTGESLITGAYNTFVGKDAGEDCSMGDFNVAIGANAGSQIVTGCANTLIGSDAGQAITTGMRNTCIGRKTGYSITTAENNAIIGPHSGYAITTGDNNVVVGPYSSIAMTTGYNNIAVGYKTAYSTTIGYMNVSIGDQAGYSITEGDRNISIGDSAGNSFTTGSRNTCIGMLTGAGFTGDSRDNVAIGTGALGFGSGVDITDNIAIGTSAMGSGTTSAYENISIGTYSGSLLSSGYQNTLVGYGAAAGMTTGYTNVFVGHYAGACYNGTTDYQTGAVDCIVIGRDSCTKTIADTNAIVIGTEAISEGSNTTVIGTSSTTATYLKGNIITNGGLTLNTDKFIVDGTTGDISGTGDITLNTDKFIVDGTTGDISATGDLTLNTDKFIVDSSTGDISSAGDISGTGDLTINTDKFVVTGSTGDIAATGDLTINTDKFVVDSSTGDIAATGDLTINTDKFVVDSSTGDISSAGDISGTGDLIINTDKFVVTASTGDITISGLITTSGGRIAFPATQVTSSDANTLDDYEEGSFTPGISFGSGTTGLTYSRQIGRYTKIGNFVHAAGRVTLSAKGSSTGSAVITGLPFAVNSVEYYRSAASITTINISSNGFITARVISGAVDIDILHHNTTGNQFNITDANFTDSSSISFAVTYTV